MGLGGRRGIRDKLRTVALREPTEDVGYSAVYSYIIHLSTHVLHDHRYRFDYSIHPADAAEAKWLASDNQLLLGAPSV